MVERVAMAAPFPMNPLAIVACRIPRFYS